MRLFVGCLLVLACLGCLGCLSCGTTCPTLHSTRCNGSVLELCGSNLKWQRVMDCAAVKASPAASESSAAPYSWVCQQALDGNCSCSKEGGR